MKKSHSLSAVFAQNVKKRRHLKGLTQEQLANLSGLHRTYIGGIETGSRNVSIAAIEKIAGALNVQADELLKVGGDHVE